MTSFRRQLFTYVKNNLYLLFYLFNLLNSLYHQIETLFYRVLSAVKQGIEININAENNLVIMITTKKEFLVLSLFDFMFEENRWYCLDISYTPAK